MLSAIKSIGAEPRHSSRDFFAHITIRITQFRRAVVNGRKVFRFHPHAGRSMQEKFSALVRGMFPAHWNPKLLQSSFTADFLGNSKCLPCIAPFLQAHTTQTIPCQDDGSSYKREGADATLKNHALTIGATSKTRTLGCLRRK